MADTPSPTGMPLPDAVAGNFQEAMRWFNQMWGSGADSAARASGPIPSMFMPTLDVKELDKRITDLRSVEHWLQLNLGLLQTTIQGLEMQRTTLAAWQSFGAAAGPAASAAAGSAPAAKDASASATGTPPPFDPTQWWAALHQQFTQMAAAAAAGAPADDAGAGADPSPDATSTAKGSGSARGSSARTAAKPRGAGTAGD